MILQLFFTAADSPLTIHYFAETTDSDTGITSECRNEEFTINIYDLPPATIPDITPIVTCISYTLPVIPDLNADGSTDPTSDIYYTNTTGTVFQPGDSVTVSDTYTIHNTEHHPFTNSDGDPDNWPCPNSNSFEVTIINEPNVDPQCDEYTLPPLENGNYFDAPGGTGNLIPFGTEYIYDATSPVNNMYDIYVYTETTPTNPPTANCSDNYMFTLIINVTPEVDSLGDENNEIKRCIDDPYTLPAITNGNYYDASGGPTVGNLIPVGTQITTEGTHTYFIYNEVNGCPAETSFTIEIRALPNVDNFTDVYECEPYTLPDLTDGNYFNSPGGINDPNLPVYQAGSIVGSEILPGTIANEAISVYIYNEWDDITGCSEETIFTVYILGINLGEFENKNECDSYTLPPLAVGNYFNEPQLNQPPSSTLPAIKCWRCYYQYANNLCIRNKWDTRS